MKISSIVTPKSTGYAAAAGLVMSVASGVTKNRVLRRTHKPAAYAAAVLTAVHIGLIEYYHHKYKKM